jgi:hypothetical protein
MYTIAKKVFFAIISPWDAPNFAWLNWNRKCRKPGNVFLTDRGYRPGAIGILRKSGIPGKFFA